tara:strand:+ start:311 stop:493 length:183 start_codon:yes stop_codon:yes gene_type:complete
MNKNELPPYLTFPSPEEYEKDLKEEEDFLAMLEEFRKVLGVKRCQSTSTSAEVASLGSKS